MKRHHYTGLMTAILLLALSLTALSCTAEPSTTNTITTESSATPTLTEDGHGAVAAFLDAAQDRYREGITCGGNILEPSLGISEDEFLSIDVSNEDALYIRQRPYLYVALPNYLGYVRGTINLGGYVISFSDPEPGVTRTGGGMAVTMKVFRDDQLLGKETYYDTILNIIGVSVGVTAKTVDEVRFLSIYYKPDCENMESMTLVLAPVPPPQEDNSD